MPHKDRKSKIIQEKTEYTAWNLKKRKEDKEDEKIIKYKHKYLLVNTVESVLNGHGMKRKV